MPRRANYVCGYAVLALLLIGSIFGRAGSTWPAVGAFVAAIAVIGPWIAAGRKGKPVLDSAEKRAKWSEYERLQSRWLLFWVGFWGSASGGAVLIILGQFWVGALLMAISAGLWLAWTEYARGPVAAYRAKNPRPSERAGSHSDP